MVCDIDLSKKGCEIVAMGAENLVEERIVTE